MDKQLCKYKKFLDNLTPRIEFIGTVNFASSAFYIGQQ